MFTPGQSFGMLTGSVRMESWVDSFVGKACQHSPSPLVLPPGIAEAGLGSNESDPSGLRRHHTGEQTSPHLVEILAN